MLPLSLHFSLTAYGQFIGRKTNKAFHKIARQIFERDKHTCQFCGFQTKKFQEVVNIDHNYKHNTLDNMTTACCFCAQYHFMESVGEKGYGGGTLLYFPEITQNELNALSHVLFFSINTGSSQKESAQILIQSFRTRANTVNKVIGEGMSDPAALGQLLLDYTSNKTDPAVDALLSQLRLLPSRGRFTKQIEYWAKHAGA